MLGGFSIITYNSRMKAPKPQYIPGVCNIGPAEIRARQLVGWVGLATTIAVWGAPALRPDASAHTAHRRPTSWSRRQRVYPRRYALLRRLRHAGPVQYGQYRGRHRERLPVGDAPGRSA